MVKREDTGKLAPIEIEAENQVFDLLELSRSPLKFDEDAILCMHREGEDENVSEVTNLNEIVNPQIIWVVKEKKTDKKTMKGPSKFMKRNGRYVREPTKQEKLMEKLKIQAMSNKTEQTEGKSKGFRNIKRTILF